MRKIGDHAVVLGASMSGLLAARVLAYAYQRVTVLDRDPLPQHGAGRKGVPQGRPAHALLPRGAQILDELFPAMLAAWQRPGCRSFTITASCGSRRVGTCCAARVNRATPVPKARPAPKGHQGQRPQGQMGWLSSPSTL